MNHTIRKILLIIYIGCCVLPDKQKPSKNLLWKLEHSPNSNDLDENEHQEQKKKEIILISLKTANPYVQILLESRLLSHQR